MLTVGQLKEILTSVFKNFANVRDANAYMEEMFGLVKPKSVILGHQVFHSRVKKSFRHIVKPVRAYYVPFLQQLTSLLNVPQIYAMLQSNPNNDLSVMKDIS